MPLLPLPGRRSRSTSAFLAQKELITCLAGRDTFKSFARPRLKKLVLATELGSISVQPTNGTRVRIQDPYHGPGLASTVVYLAPLFSTNGYNIIIEAQ